MTRVKVRFGRGEQYYMDIRYWLKDRNITEWRWDDAKYEIVFKHNEDATVFKLCHPG